MEYVKSIEWVNLAAKPAVRKITENVSNRFAQD